MQYKVYQICSTCAYNDVQDLDARCDQALLSASESPAEMVSEGFYKTELQDSVQLQSVLAWYDQGIARNIWQPSYSSMKAAARLHIDQTMRTLNLRVRDEIVERGMVTKSQKEKKESLC